MTETTTLEQEKTVIQEQIVLEESHSKTQDLPIEKDQPSAKENLYWALLPPPKVHISRQRVGKNAIWDYDIDFWFFQHKEEAELIAEKLSKNGQAFHVQAIPSKIAEGFLHGSPQQKKAINKRCDYEIKCSEFKEKEKIFDEDCRKYNIDKSFIPGDAPKESSETEKKAYAYLNKKWEALQNEKTLLDELRKQCEKKERQLKQKNTPSDSYNEFDENGSEENGELQKARTNAKRRALIYQLTQEEIVKDICKQNPSLSDQAEEIADQALLWAERYQPDSEMIVGGIPKTITDMQSLDARYAQLEAPGQPCVIIHRPDAQPISSKDFNQRLSGEVVVAGIDDKGQPKYLDANKFWTGNTNKRIYKRIAFTNQSIAHDTYNLFTGFGVKPKEGKCDKILAHIKDVICAGNEINSSALLKLLAWQIQNIGKPSRIITALKSSQQQSGKGILLEQVLGHIYGNSGFQTNEMGQITARFNDTLRGKAYIYLDEALFSGDRKSADSLKSLSTTITTSIEQKGVPTVQLPIALNFFLATNHEDAAHIEEADARYWILEVSPHRVGDADYFKELVAEIETGGREAFMYFLLHLDVKDFIPSRDVPKDNDAKKAMIRNSINPFDARKWLEECCRSGMILGFRMQGTSLPNEPWKQGDEYQNGIFWTAYTDWQKSVKSPVAAKPTPANKFGELLTSVGLSQRKSGDIRYRTLPEIEECLKIVKEMIENAGNK
jgi:hypothetical protein